MSNGDLQAVVEELIQTVAFLCDETASLVQERAKREPLEDQDGVRGKAELIRENARSLRAILDKAQ